MAGGGCRGPTQLTVDVRTIAPLRCSDLKTVTLGVASTPAAAEAKLETDFVSAEVRQRCDSEDRVGTLVLTKATDTGAIVVAADYLGKGGCKPPSYEGCIVARRAFSFIDDAALYLPITLDISCLDVPCGVLTSCRSGICVSSSAECSEDGTCRSEAEPVFGADGRPVPPDGSIDAREDGAAVDSAADGVEDAQNDVAEDARVSDAPPDGPADALSDAIVPDAPFDGPVTPDGGMTLDGG